MYRWFSTLDNRLEDKSVSLRCSTLKLLLPTLLGGGLFQGGITIHKTTHKTESGFFVKWTFRDWLGLCILIVVVFALLSGVIPADELLDKLLKKS